MAVTSTEIALATSAGNTGVLSVVRRASADFIGQAAVRRTLPLLAVVLLTAFGLLAYHALKAPSLRVLLPEIGDADKALVLETLHKQGITARVDSNSGLLEVPEAAYHRSRIVLAQNDLPRTATAGYALLDELPLGVSQPVEQARLRQTQETELSRSIETIDPVESARVHLAIPPRSALARETPPSRASIMVKVRSGRALEEGQVAAIVHLVASSVPSLVAANVTVVDQHGKLLSSGSGTALQDVSEEQINHQKALERLYRERVLALLSPLVGFSNLTTEVTATLDFTSSEATSESFAEPGRLRSESVSESSTTNPAARGIPGAVSNTPPPAADVAATPPAAQTGEAAANTTENRSSSQTRNFEVGRELRTTRAPGAHLRKLSVAVVVREAPPAHTPKDASDDDKAGDTADGSTAASSASASPYDKERLTALVKDAVGFDDKRGDSVTVAILPFAEPTEIVERPWYEAAWVADGTKALGAALVLGILAFGVLRPLAPRLFEHHTALASSDAAALLEEDLPTDTIASGQSLEELKAKLKPKRSGISMEMLDTANTYDDKVALIRMLVTEDSARVTNVFRQLMRGEISG